MYVLPNISRSKGNQVIKFGELIEYNMTNIFLKNLYGKAENQAGWLVLDLVLFFKKALCRVKASDQQLSFNIFW